MQLEPGGKNAAIVLADADLDHAPEQVAHAAFLSTGQGCVGPRRVVADRRVADELGQRLVVIAGRWTIFLEPL